MLRRHDPYQPRQRLPDSHLTDLLARDRVPRDPDRVRELLLSPTELRADLF
jgi:hypothetical protein